MSLNYLTVKEVAAVFKKDIKTIYRWIEARDPIREFTRVKDGILIPHSEVERILSEGKNQDISDLVSAPTKKRPSSSGFVGRWRK